MEEEEDNEDDEEEHSIDYEEEEQSDEDDDAMQVEEADLGDMQMGVVGTLDWHARQEEASQVRFYLFIFVLEGCRD